MSDAPRRTLKFFWFHVGGEKFSDLDLTGAEAIAIKAKTGVEWNALQPLAVEEHKIVMLETFHARTDPEGSKRYRAMTVKELKDLVSCEWEVEDDLPDNYRDGLPLADKAES